MMKNGITIRGAPAICKESVFNQLMTLIEPKEDERKILIEYIKSHTLQDLLERFPELGLRTETEQRLAALSIIADVAENHYDF